MVIVKKLYCAIPFAFLLNVIVLFVNAFHQYKPKQKSQHPEAVWSWKDSLIVVISLLSMVSICILGFVASEFLRKELAILIFMPMVISYFLQPAVFVIPSIKTMSGIIGHNNNEKLNVKENATLLLLSLIVVVFAQFDLYSRAKAYIIQCNHPIYVDLLLAISTFLWVSLPVFFICALAVTPLQFFILWIKHFYRKNTWKRAKKVEERINRRFSGIIDKQFSETIVKKALIITLVEFWRKKTTWVKILLCIVMPIVFFLDIIRYSLSIFGDFYISIFWNSYQIIRQLGTVFTKMAKWIVSVSDRTIIATSFRITIIVGLSATVIINRYEPFFLKREESTAVLEFISSAIVIPVIFEWIISFKNKRIKPLH